MGPRGWLVAAYMIVLSLLGLVVVWVLASFAMPEDEHVEIGQLSDFPPSAQPYKLRDPLHLFVVNDDRSSQP